MNYFKPYVDESAFKLDELPSCFIASSYEEGVSFEKLVEIKTNPIIVKRARATSFCFIS